MELYGHKSNDLSMIAVTKPTKKWNELQITDYRKMSKIPERWLQITEKLVQFQKDKFLA